MSTMLHEVLFTVLTISVLSLVHGQSINLKATFNMAGIRGHVTFTMTTQSSPVNVRLNLTGVTTDYSWQIRQFPTNYDLKERCLDSDIGQLYTSLDLSLRHGDIMPSNQMSAEYTDSSSSIKLSGPLSIAGRTLVLIDKTTSKRVCATIRHTDVAMVTAFAHFPATVGGTVWLRQSSSSDFSSDTTVYADLFYIDGTQQNTNLPWAILNNKIMAEVKAMALTDRCTNLGSVYNPNGQSSSGCSTNSQSSCVIGDLTNKHGQVDVAINKGQMKMFHTDSNLPLSGPNSVIGKTIVLYKPDRSSILACASINELGPKNVSVIFNMKGVTGSVDFSQDSPFEATTVDINLKHLRSNAKTYHIHKFPMPDRPSSDYDLCSGEAVSGHLNPFEVVISEVPAPGVGTNDQYEVGDLSSKYGILGGMEVSAMYIDWNLPLFGLNSIIGRSVVVHKNSGSRWVCANVPYQSKQLKTAMVTFKYPVIGTMVFRQDVNDPHADTTVTVDLAHADGTEMTMGHKWHVHVQPIGDDFMANTGRCQVCKGHYNPFGVHLTSNYSRSCSARNPLRCECGDLSGKHGTLTIGSDKAMYKGFRAFYTDIALPLSGISSIVKRSVVIHDKNKGAGRFSCGTIYEVKPVIAMLNSWTSSVSGQFKLMQQYDHTWITGDVKSLQKQADTYHIHNLPVPSGQASPCSGSAVGGHFNPFGVNVTASPMSTSGTADQYEVGDLSGKYGTMKGQQEYTLDAFDNNLPLNGYNSVVGRSIVIHRSDQSKSRWTCGNVELATNMMGGRSVSAIARFQGELSGYVHFKQMINEDGSERDTTIVMDVYYTNDQSKKTLDHNWHIHVTPVGTDGESPLGRCVSCGGHYNPFKVNVKTGYKTSAKGCSSKNPLRCEMGDLSGKQGRYSLGTGRHLFNDVDVPLDHQFSVIGRSIVFHEKNGGAPRIACADILPESSETVQLHFETTDQYSKSELAEAIASSIQTDRWNIVPEIAKQTGNCMSVKVHLTGVQARQLKTKLESNIKAKDSSLGRYTTATKAVCDKDADRSLPAEMLTPGVQSVAGSVIQLSLWLVMLSLMLTVFH